MVALGSCDNPCMTVSHSSCSTALRTNESISSFPAAEQSWLSRWRAKAADDAVTVSPGTSSSRNIYNEQTANQTSWVVYSLTSCSTHYECPFGVDLPRQSLVWSKTPKTKHNYYQEQHKKPKQLYKKTMPYAQTKPNKIMFKEHGVCPMLSLTLFKIVIAYLDSYFVVMATGVGRSKICLTSCSSPTPKKPLLVATMLEISLIQAKL